MQVLRTLADLAALTNDVCLAIGVFDGLHLGHQRVIAQARADAATLDAVTVVMTFDPHPQRVLQPQQAPPLLTSTRHKLRIMAPLGVDICLVVTFDQVFARTEAEEFVLQLTSHCRRLREICVGTRFRFGHGRAGDCRLLERLAPRHGFTAREVTPVTAGTEIISSTAVRRHLQHGHLDRAAAMLGRPFSLLGTVERGDGRGSQLGFPTANVQPDDELSPPDGVYAAVASTTGGTWTAMVNIGFRPTFQASAPRRVIEAHLLDFTGDLYGHDLELAFHRRLRDEQSFSSRHTLQQQLAADARESRRVIASLASAKT
ncbi:riboflavin biosynthesis protein RibF [bacterium]|nr:riboflavin biosynthesis protein RibF [bacterium]